MPINDWPMDKTKTALKIGFMRQDPQGEGAAMLKNRLKDRYDALIIKERALCSYHQDRLMFRLF